MPASMARTPASDTSAPITAPTPAITVASTSNCRITRARLAPSEVRIAISGARLSARAIIRFATFAQATRTTMMPAMMNCIQPSSVPSSRSVRGTTRARRLRFVSG